MTPAEKKEFLKEGMKVMVVLPEEVRPGYEELYSTIRKYNGRAMTIVCVLRTAKGHYYELDKAVSPYDIPYGFVGEWLIPIVDV